MPDFHDQLSVVSGLRKKCRECDDELYRTRIQLDQAARDRRRADEQPTIIDHERETAAADVRSRIADVDARLAGLREEARQIAEWFARLDDLRRLAEHLQQNLSATQTRSGALLERLAELRQRVPAPEGEIRDVEEELAKLEKITVDLSSSLRKVLEEIHGREGEEDDQRSSEQGIRREIEALRDELRRLQEQLDELLESAFVDTDEPRSRYDDLVREVDRIQENCGDCDGRLHDGIVDLYERDPHPKHVLPNLDDRVPFLLFPVRLETIFVPVRGDESPHTELWVRVYPDEIAVHTHEKLLTKKEVIAGELYWTELLAAEHLREERDARRRAAWRHIVELFGGQRASWIARQTKPSNWDPLVAQAAAQSLPDLLIAADAQFFTDLLALDLPDPTRTQLLKIIEDSDGDAFFRLAETQKWLNRISTAVRSVITGFPVHDLTKTDGWTRAPRTQVMPDRWVLLLYPNDSEPPREVVGEIIPDTLFVGPEPLDAKNSFPEKDGVLTYGSSFDWMSDFGKAVEQGMGFRVRLTDAEARLGFERVVVLGLMLSASETESAEILEELIDNHQFGPKGFSIVPQGTPTNNTERDGSGYSDNDPYNDLAFFTAVDAPAFDPANADVSQSQTDGRRLADALGISYAPLQTVQYANRTDILDASLMNAALFPSTLGYWLRSWVAPVATPELAREVRSFFTQYVSGRGPVPAVRVGNQPYGILLTSDFSRWKYPEGDDIFVAVRSFRDPTRFLKDLHALLVQLQKVWDGIVAELMFVGKKNTDSSDVLMNILGLQPTSAEFFQRIGYSHEYLRNLLSFKDGGRNAGELNSHMLGMPAIARSYLLSLGIQADISAVQQMRGLKVLWQHYTTHLDVPNLVENRPPSESDTLAVNYINALAEADTTQKIINQEFAGAVPSALLYLLLRNALLLQLHNGAYEWLQERTIFEPQLELAARATTLPGVRASQPTVSKLEIMNARVEAAEPTHPVPNLSVADWIWKGPSPTEAEAAFLREQKAALVHLAKSTTAQLERCLVEHLDCCEYRLDAWQTGLFAQRLQAQRSFGDDRKIGIHLGAFGWVEQLKPSAKTFLERESVPESLRPTDGNPILEEDDGPISGTNPVAGSRQGGFVHAPSLNHAAAAALLRSAYLSHATPEQAEMFAVNLSSERVRRAQFILEGMRNGQPIEALLGYQFERGLHDRTSESVARGDLQVLELNQFIVPFREVFKFESREVVQVGTGSASETMPPFNVVNGLKLSEASLSAANAFGLESVLAAAERPNSNQGAAILAEQNVLRDTLDAVKDVLMAENAYQLAKGNFDRVAAVSLSQKDAHIPPELEVVQTPRGSEFTFTNRMTLHFEDLDPVDGSANPWSVVSMTPRALAEPGMNKWLGKLFGSPEKINCDVYWVDASAPTSQKDLHGVRLSDLGLQPVDFAWLVNTSIENTLGATELETRIAYRYRRSHGIRDDKTVRIEFNPAVPSGELSFAQLFPLARHVRALLSESRSLDAEDFLPSPSGKDTDILADKINPKGYDIAELTGRVQSALNAMNSLAGALDGAAAPTLGIVLINPEDDGVDIPFTGQLGAVFDKLEERKLTFADTAKLTINFSIADAEILHATLRAIAGFGISDAFPAETDLLGDAAKRFLLDRAFRIARQLRRIDPADGILDRATELFNEAAANKPIQQKVTDLLAAAKILFGETFNFLPKFRCHNEIDLAASDGDREQLLEHAFNVVGITKEDVVDEWLQNIARVRSRMRRWETVVTLADMLTEEQLKIRPVQVPYRANDSWLAVEFPLLDPNNTDPENPDKPFGVSGDTLSIIAHGDLAFKAGTRQSGVLIDDWSEEIPTEDETTGIAFRFNQPNAEPPQTLLLAVTPEETGSWEWDDLVGTLIDTLRRAKRRAVEPAQLERQGLGWNAFAPALVSEFSTLKSNDVSLDLMLMLDFEPLNDFYVKAVKT